MQHKSMYSPVFRKFVVVIVDLTVLQGRASQGKSGQVSQGRSVRASQCEQVKANQGKNLKFIAQPSP